MKNLIVFFCGVLLVASCDHREILYSGFNDLTVGSQTLILYNDNTFYIEMGAGGVEGNYQIKHDTIKLRYDDKPSTNWPDVILIRKDYFISLDSLDNQKYLKIVRHK